MKRSVSVERLTVRVRGVSPEAAREAAGGLGRELLEELARGGGPRRGHARIERVVANVPGEEAGAGQGLGRSVARSVADAVRARTK
jgi:hypothetical protein